MLLRRLLLVLVLDARGGARLDLRSVLPAMRGAMDMRCFLVLEVEGLELELDSNPAAMETRRLVEIPPSVVRRVFTMVCGVDSRGDGSYVCC